MTLSDIKFTYEDKIDNLNNRMEKYEDIIKSYNKKIRRAEKEETPNVSSLIKAKEQYEHKIENMGVVKEYYQEFVDTADYLLQNLNGNKAVLSNMKYEILEKKNVKLSNEVEELENTVYGQENELKRLRAYHEANKDRLQKQGIKLNEQRKKINEQSIEIDNQKKEIRELKSKQRKKIRQLKSKQNEKIAELKEKSKEKSKKGMGNYKQIEKELVKLSEENTYFKNVNGVLQKRNERLVDYCNHLLNRRSDELPAENTVSENNIFKQLIEGNTPPLFFYGVNDEF